MDVSAAFEQRGDISITSSSFSSTESHSQLLMAGAYLISTSVSSSDHGTLHLPPVERRFYLSWSTHAGTPKRGAVQHPMLWFNPAPDPTQWGLHHRRRLFRLTMNNATASIPSPLNRDEELHTLFVIPLNTHLKDLD